MRRATVRSIAITALGAMVCSVSVIATGIEVDAASPPEKFKTICASCHGEKGKGDGPAAKPLEAMVKVRDFTKCDYMSKRTDAQLTNVIKNGGPSEKLNPLMAAFGPQLTDKEIKEIVAYIRSLCPKKK